MECDVLWCVWIGSAAIRTRIKITLHRVMVK
jgi:hypothetical protein